MTHQAYTSFTLMMSSDQRDEVIRAFKKTDKPDELLAAIHENTTGVDALLNEVVASVDRLHGVLESVSSDTTGAVQEIMDSAAVVTGTQAATLIKGLDVRINQVILTNLSVEEALAVMTDSIMRLNTRMDALHLQLVRVNDEVTHGNHVLFNELRVKKGCCVVQ